MLETILIILVIAWALGFFAFKVTSAFIHILLVLAVVVLILRLLRGRRKTEL
ncbi:MAG TPA: lmo0937 family membrane protein [Candidatus Deferrimicrobium sp.]|nr:lmo0937 family membrane protein [Candidatus Deferrimicrobium sp.]